MNPYSGSNFDDFLKEDGILEEVTATAHKRAMEQSRMNKYCVVIFDVDDTLRRCKRQGQIYPVKPDDWELIPGVKAKLASLDWNRIGVGFASNQGGVGLGYLTEKMAYRMIQDTVESAFDGFPHNGIINLCPHAPADNCSCRKPKPHMLLDIMYYLSCCEDHSHTLMVGDKESDRGAAINAGCDFMWAKDFFGWAER